VRVEFEHEVKALGELAGADVVVACDGVASWVRDALAAELRPAVDVRPNRFVWLGCTVPYRAFTFLFKQTPHGMFRVHAYPYTDLHSHSFAHADTHANTYGHTNDHPNSNAPANSHTAI